MEYSAGGKKYTIPVATPNKAIRAVPPKVFVVITVLFCNRLFFRNGKAIHWIKIAKEEKIRVLSARHETLHDIRCNLLPRLESLCRLSIDSIPSHPVLLESISQVC